MPERTPARCEDGLGSGGRQHALLLLVPQSTGLMAAVTIGQASCGNLFQQRHIKHGFLRLLPLKPPTRHRVCAPRRPSRIDPKGGSPPKLALWDACYTSAPV
jgi:hypothetical protein